MAPAAARTSDLEIPADLGHRISARRALIVERWTGLLDGFPGDLEARRVLEASGGLWLDALIADEAEMEGRKRGDATATGSSDLELSLAAMQRLLEVAVESILPPPSIAEVLALHRRLERLASRHVAARVAGMRRTLRRQQARQIAEGIALQEATAALFDMEGLADLLSIVCREALRLAGVDSAAVVVQGIDGASRCATAGHRGGELLARRPGVVQLPLRVRGDEGGVLLLPELPAAKGRLLALFADQVAIAVTHARLHESHRRLDVLHERRKLAHELHDSVTQALYGLGMASEAAVRFLESGDLSRAGELVRDVRDTALGALREMRLVLFELRPARLEPGGLVEALRDRLARVEERAGMRTVLRHGPLPRLPTSFEETLHGIASEALNNALKHSRADCIEVELARRGGFLVLTVRDDGCGFDSRRGPGQGLPSLHERAASLGGELVVETSVGSGTTVRATVPLPQEESS